MFFGMTFFLNFLQKLWKCTPRQGREHISESRFLPTSCPRPSFHAQNGFKTLTLGGAFPSCAVQKIIHFADWAENGRLGKLFLTSLVFSHAFWIRFSHFRSWFCHSSKKLYLTSLGFSHVFGIRFLYFHPWFCHSSWKLYLMSRAFSHVSGSDFYIFTIDFVIPPEMPFF